MKRGYFEKAVEIINDKGKVRQKDLKNTTSERYVLDILVLIPRFERVKEHDDEKVKKHIITLKEDKYFGTRNKFNMPNILCITLVITNEKESSLLSLTN